MPCPKVKNVVTTEVADKWDVALGSCFSSQTCVSDGPEVLGIPQEFDP